MRKAATILLFFIIFCSESGYYFFYSFQQYQLKQQAKKEFLSSIPAASFEMIEQEKNAHLIQWEEDEKEFYLNGQLYDVKKTVKTNGKTILYCLNDIKEELLIKEMSNAAQQGDNKSTGKKNNHPLKFQLNDFLVDSTEILSIPSSCLQQFFFRFNETVFATGKEIIVPPPRV